MNEMYCPNCGAEYRPGFTRCADCDVDLVREPPSDDDRLRPSSAAFDPGSVPGLVEVYSTDRMRAELVRSLLEGNGIPVVVSGEGQSSAYPLTVGALGEGRVMVREQDRDRALETIATARADQLGLDEEEEDDYELPGRPWALWVIAALVALALIAATLVDVR